MIRFATTLLPWLLPGLALSMAIGLFVSRPIGRLLTVGRPLAWAIVAGFGLIVSATLTPLRGGLDLQAVATGT